VLVFVCEADRKFRSLHSATVSGDLRTHYLTYMPNDGSVSIETDNGRYAGGDGTSLPDGVPVEVPTPDNVELLSAMSDNLAVSVRRGRRRSR
jgi:hypothetical protein